MKKGIWATVTTLSLTVVIIGGNAVFATNMLKSEVPDISAELIPGKTANEHTDAKANGANTTAPQPDTEVSESEAVQIAKSAIADSYDVNTDGLSVFTALDQSEKTTENVWFVHFRPAEFTDEAPQVRRPFGNAVFTTYVVLINTDTGEIVEMEQNTIDPTNIPQYNPELDRPGLG